VITCDGRISGLFLCQLLLSVHFLFHCSTLSDRRFLADEAVWLRETHLFSMLLGLFLVICCFLMGNLPVVESLEILILLVPTISPQRNPTLEHIPSLEGAILGPNRSTAIWPQWLE
jgi:hypothetical protein